jgi:hypothetical protein
MTAKELKLALDKHIESNKKGDVIFLPPHLYDKAWYSCTADEVDFKMHKGGIITYKGFKIKAPYK